MDRYFDYIIYEAFDALLTYENKRSLSIEQLHNYRMKICEKHMKYFSKYTEYDDEELEKNLKAFHNRNMAMTLEEENENLKVFLLQHDDIFAYENGTINLTEKLSLKEFRDAKNELGYFDHGNVSDKIICSHIVAFYDCEAVLDIIGATTIKQKVYELVSLDKKLEMAYLNGNVQDAESIRDEINKIISLIGNLPEELVRCYHRIIMSIEDPNVKGEEYELTSQNLYDSDEFYKLNVDYIEFLLYQEFQNAIFNVGALAYHHLADYMDELWAYRMPDTFPEIEPVDQEAFLERLDEKQAEYDAFEDEFDDEDYDDDEEYDPEEEYWSQIEYHRYRKKVKRAYYLTFIKMVNKFQETFGHQEELERSKTRLLFLLDVDDEKLYIEENLNNIINTISISDLDYKEDFDDYYKLSRVFLIDLLEGWIDDERTLRKILFISAYYDLTKDRRIIKIISKYIDTELGRKMFDVVVNQDYKQFNQSNTSIVRNRIPKKTPQNEECN